MRGDVVAVLLLAGVLASPVRAAEEEPDLAQLRARLAALETEHAQEVARAQAAEAKARERHEELRSRRHELASEIVTLELARHELRARVAAARRQLEEGTALAEELAAFEQSIRTEGVALAEQLKLVLDATPGTAGASARAEALARAPDEPEGAAGLMALLDDAHAMAGSVTVREIGLRTADGALETAQLLAAGNVAFAYRVGGRCAVALASPVDASGFRWTESIDRRTAAAVGAAIDAVTSGATRCDLPFDASGMLRHGSALDEWTLGRVWEAGGPVMWPLAGVALLALALVLERAFFLLRQGGSGQALLARVLEACDAGDLAAARARAARGRGLVARGLAACLREVEAGPQAMEDDFSEQLLHELPRLERSLAGIGTLAAVAPLLGLLGTVTGIIQTFGVIKIFGNANPGLMASGIAEALVTTATGLVIAIPTLLAHSLLRARVDLLTGYAEEGAATLLNRLRPEKESCAS